MQGIWKHGLRRLTLALVLVSLAAVLLGSVRMTGGTHVGQAQQAEDPVLLRELAERVLAPPYPGPTGTQQRARLYPGALPDDLPLDLPQDLPFGSRLVGSVVRQGPPNGHNTDVVLDVPGSTADIVAFFTTALVAAGWTASGPSGPQQGGFVPQTVTSRTFCQTDANAFINLNVFATGSEISDVRLNVISGAPGPCGAPGGVRPPSLPPGAGLLPALTSPPGIALQSGGNRGSPGSLASDATIAETDLSQAELADHYAEQLVAAGWTLLERRTDGLLAWSVWSVPAEQGTWQGFLYVRQGAAPKQRLLHVEVASAEVPQFGR